MKKMSPKHVAQEILLECAAAAQQQYPDFRVGVFAQDAVIEAIERVLRAAATNTIFNDLKEMGKAQAYFMRTIESEMGPAVERDPSLSLDKVQWSECPYAENAYGYFAKAVLDKTVNKVRRLRLAVSQENSMN